MLPTTSQMQQNSNADQKLLPRFPTPSDSVISGGGDDTAPATPSVLGGGGGCVGGGGGGTGGMGPSEDIWDLDSNTVKRYTLLDPVSISTTSAGLSIGDQNSNPWSPMLNQTQQSSYSSWGGPGSNSSTSSTSIVSNPLPEFQSNFPASSTSNGVGVGGAYDFYQTPAPSGPTTSPSPMQHSDSNKASFLQQPAEDLKRPKSYQCDACDKWFTSSGHLKRHFNTTLHKNAMRQRGGSGSGVGAGRGSPMANGNSNTGNVTPSRSPLESGHVPQLTFPTYLQQVNSGNGGSVEIGIMGDSSSINTTPPLDIGPTTSQINNSTYQQNHHHHHLHHQQHAHHNFNQQSQHQGGNLTSTVPNHQINHIHHQQGTGISLGSSISSSSAASASPLYAIATNAAATSTSNSLGSSGGRGGGERGASPGLNREGNSPGNSNASPPGDGLKMITNSDCMFSGADASARNSNFFLTSSHSAATTVPDVAGSGAYEILHTSSYSHIQQQEQQQQQQPNSNSPVSDSFLLVPQQQYGYALTTDDAAVPAAVVAGTGNARGPAAIGSSSYGTNVPGTGTDLSQSYQTNGFDYNASSVFGANDVMYDTTTTASSLSSTASSTISSTPPPTLATSSAISKLKVKDNKNEKEQHTGEFRCHECNKVFNRICYLKQHNKTFHNGEKPVSKWILVQRSVKKLVRSFGP